MGRDTGTPTIEGTNTPLKGVGDGGRLPGAPWPMAVGLSLALLGPPVLQRLPVPDGLKASGILVDNMVMWALAVGVAGLVLMWERRPLASIGLARLPARTALLAAGAGILITAVGLLSTGLYVALSGTEQPPEGLGTIGALSIPFRIFLVLTAAVTEETLYRGYAIERLAELTGRVWVGACLAGAVFLAVHIPFWGPAALPLQTTATVGLVVLYARTRNLPAAMIAHAIVNTIMLIVLPEVA